MTDVLLESLWIRLERTFSLSGTNQESKIIPYAASILWIALL